MRPSARRISLAIAPALLLAGCISFGSKPPKELLRLTPAQTAPADTGDVVAAGRAITVMIPTTPAELQNNRVPVRSGATTLAYVKDATWADAPARLFRDLLAETIRARTGRPVLDAREYHLAPGLKLSGRIQQFGLDADAHQIMMVFDATLQYPDNRIVTRRFIASAPAGQASFGGVAPALDTVANQVAAQVSDWVGR